MSVEQFLNWHARPLSLGPVDRIGDCSRVVVDPPVPWVRKAPLFIANLSGNGVDYPIVPTTLTRHGTFRTTIDNGIIFGTHHFLPVIQEDGLINLHETDPENVVQRIKFYISANPNQSNLGPIVSYCDGSFFCSTDHLSADDISIIDEPVFFGSPNEPDNYGMWLVSGLPRAADFCRSENKGKYFCWLRFEWQYRLLEFMGITKDNLIIQEPHKTYYCRQITMHQYTHIDISPNSRDLELFSEIRSRCLLKAPSVNSERIFISRRSFARSFSHRRLVNEDALIEALEARGFVVVEPETLDFATQVATFARARVVVGVGGAALFNSVFCNPRTVLVSIESTTAFFYGHSNLFSTLDLEYGFILGQPDESDLAVVHKRWTVDVEKAVAQIMCFID